MAIELHHLHPGHDDEVSRLKARIAELERMDTEHTLQIAKMNGYISHLEDVLEHHGKVLPKEHEFVMNNPPLPSDSKDGKKKDIVFYNTKCCVCGELVTHNEGKILQPQIYVCQFCRENARQMLQIKKFATETNLKVEIKGLNNDNLQ